jgi:hypothetical protein
MKYVAFCTYFRGGGARLSQPCGPFATRSVGDEEDHNEEDHNDSERGTGRRVGFASLFWQQHCQLDYIYIFISSKLY